MYKLDTNSYDVMFYPEIRSCLTNRLWNCSWYTSGTLAYSSLFYKSNKILKPGNTTTMWQGRKDNLAALWLDFDNGPFLVTVKLFFNTRFTEILNFQHLDQRTTFSGKISAIGGIFGLFLGFSCLTIFDMILMTLEQLLTGKLCRMLRPN